MESIIHTLHNALEKLAIPYTEENIASSISFLQLLTRWNKHTNLVGKDTELDIFTDLFMDSIHLASVLRTLPLDTPFTIDLGAGAGIPGIPLRIFWNAGKYTMVEAREKRVLFMERALQCISLEHTYIIQKRAEDYFKHCETLPDIIISRAFMPPEKLLDFCLPYMKEGAFIVLMTHHSLIQHISYEKYSTYTYSVNDTCRCILVLQKK